LLAACQTGSKPPAPAVVADNSGICLSPLKALSDESQRLNDIRIQQKRDLTRDERGGWDVLVDKQLDIYYGADCNVEASSKLRECIDDGTEAGLTTIEVNAALHRRCFGAIVGTT